MRPAYVQFKRTKLKNGLRIVTEDHPSSRSVAIGIWVLTGTRDESPREAGISHLLEHMVFKGTKTKTAHEIAKSLEQLGGELNAYTTREYTVYHCLVLKEHWKQGLNVLSDLVSNMQTKEEDCELEKSVILQEIATSKDDLEDFIYDVYFEQSLAGSPLGKPVLGHVESIKQITLAQVEQYYNKHYSANNMIVAAAGSLNHQDFATHVEKLLGTKGKHHFKRDRKKPKHKSIRFALEKPSEQIHLCMGFPVTSFCDPHRFDAFIVNALMGGGMSSKLYQSTREKKGLAYSIYSSLNTFKDFGCINIYAAGEKKNIKAIFQNIKQEIYKLHRHSISQKDLDLYKTQVKGSIILGAEDVENRMTSIGVNEMVFREYKSLEAVIGEIDQVSISSITSFIKKYVHLKNFAIILLGGGASDFQSWLMEKTIEK